MGVVGSGLQGQQSMDTAQRASDLFQRMAAGQDPDCVLQATSYLMIQMPRPWWWDWAVVFDIQNKVTESPKFDRSECIYSGPVSCLVVAEEGILRVGRVLEFVVGYGEGGGIHHRFVCIGAERSMSLCNVVVALQS